jgi:lipopolysaccharide/colanic/teichoic acid biosynthesis glycosyltransferase
MSSSPESLRSLDALHGRFLEDSDARPSARVRQRSQAGWPLRAKRALDVAGAGVLLVGLAPVLALLAAGIRLTSRGPAVFVQPRVGANGRTFRMYKFRTMVRGADRLEEALARERGATFFKMHGDPRVTKVGRLLRRASLDELPQLWNVVRGDMSLVGPRPLLLTDLERFPEGSGTIRFSVPPGITGLWQVSGRSALSDEERLRLDSEYVERWSLGLDARILARTLPAVISSRGAW